MDQSAILSKIRQFHGNWQLIPVMAERLEGAKFFAAHLLFSEFGIPLDEAKEMVRKACEEETK